MEGEEKGEAERKLSGGRRPSSEPIPLSGTLAQRSSNPRPLRLWPARPPNGRAPVDAQDHGRAAQAYVFLLVVVRDILLILCPFSCSKKPVSARCTCAALAGHATHTVLHRTGTQSHPHTTITIYHRFDSRPEIPPRPARLAHRTASQGRLSRRRPRPRPDSRSRFARLHNSRQPGAFTGNRPRRSNRRRAHQGEDGAHLQKEAAKGVREDDHAQADIHSSADRAT